MPCLAPHEYHTHLASMQPGECVLVCAVRSMVNGDTTLSSKVQCQSLPTCSLAWRYGRDLSRLKAWAPMRLCRSLRQEVRRPARV